MVHQGCGVCAWCAAYLSEGYGSLAILCCLKQKVSLSCGKNLHSPPTDFILTCSHQLHQSRWWKKLLQESYTPILGLGQGACDTGVYNVMAEVFASTVLQCVRVSISSNCSRVAHSCQTWKTRCMVQHHSSLTFLEKSSTSICVQTSSNLKLDNRLAHSWHDKSAYTHLQFCGLKHFSASPTDTWASVIMPLGIAHQSLQPQRLRFLQTLARFNFPAKRSTSY